MKKVLSGMIAAVMTICMSVSVFASPNSSVSIKNNDSKSTPVHMNMHLISWAKL